MPRSSGTGGVRYHTRRAGDEMPRGIKTMMPTISMVRSHSGGLTGVSSQFHGLGETRCGSRRPPRSPSRLATVSAMVVAVALPACGEATGRFSVDSALAIADSLEAAASGIGLVTAPSDCVPAIDSGHVTVTMEIHQYVARYLVSDRLGFECEIRTATSVTEGISSSKGAVLDLRHAGTDTTGDSLQIILVYTLESGDTATLETLWPLVVGLEGFRAVFDPSVEVAADILVSVSNLALGNPGAQPESGWMAMSNAGDREFGPLGDYTRSLVDGEPADSVPFTDSPPASSPSSWQLLGGEFLPFEPSADQHLLSERGDAFVRVLASALVSRTEADPALTLRMAMICRIHIVRWIKFDRWAKPFCATEILFPLEIVFGGAQVILPMATLTLAILAAIAAMAGRLAHVRTALTRIDRSRRKPGHIEDINFNLLDYSEFHESVRDWLSEIERERKALDDLTIALKNTVKDATSTINCDQVLVSLDELEHLIINTAVRALDSDGHRNSGLLNRFKHHRPVRIYQANSQITTSCIIQWEF